MYVLRWQKVLIIFWQFQTKTVIDPGERTAIDNNPANFICLVARKLESHCTLQIIKE